MHRNGGTHPFSTLPEDVDLVLCNNLPDLLSVVTQFMMKLCPMRMRIIMSMPHLSQQSTGLSFTIGSDFCTSLVPFVACCV